MFSLFRCFCSCWALFRSLDVCLKLLEATIYECVCMQSHFHINPIGIRRTLGMRTHIITKISNFQNLSKITFEIS